MTPPTTVSRLLARARTRSALTYMAIALALAAAIVVTGHAIEHHITAIETWIVDLRPWSVLVFVALFVAATSILIPDTVLAIMAGAAFGLRWGLAAVVAGSLLAAALQYALARRLLRDRIERALARRPSLNAVRHAVRRNAVKPQALLRLTPLNPATVSYVLGAAGVRFDGFLLACLALIPNLIVEVYFGYAGRHVARMAGRSTHDVYVHDLAVLGGLVATVVVVVLVSRMARAAVMESAADA